MKMLMDPSGDDLYATTGNVHDKVCIGEIILCPNSIWILIPTPARVNAFTHDPKWKYSTIGFGNAINKQYRLGRLTTNHYLDALYEEGFDVLVVERQMENC